MDIQNFITEFKKTFIYDLLSQTLTDEQLFEHAIDGDGVTWFKEQMRQMWDLWQAKAQAVPEGFVLVPKKPDKDTIIEMAAVCLMPRRKIDDIEFLSISEAKEVYQAMIKAQGPAND